MLPLGICTSSDQPLAGADFLEENVQRYLQPETDPHRPPPRALPVRAANCFLPAQLKCVGPDVDTPRLLRYAAIAFQRARQAGIQTIVFGSGGARQIPDGFSRARAEQQFLELLRALGPLAAPHHITIVIEPLQRAECNFINSVPEADALAAACNHPHIAVLADFFHMGRDDQPPDDILRHGTRLRHVHVAEKNARTPPGVAGDDFRPFLRALKTIGYRGAISIEAAWTDLAAQAPLACAALRQQIADAYA
jgi:sugar phosphate isomerase/epimerase